MKISWVVLALMWCPILALRIHHLPGFCQAAAVESAGRVYGSDGLAAGGEFAELLPLIFAAKRFQLREVLRQRHRIGNDRVRAQGIEELVDARHDVPMYAKERRRGHRDRIIYIKG